MTCRPSEIHWRDALYNSVRLAPGGINAAATYLAQRRGKAITGESLRKKLRGLDGESVSLEIAELLTEWLQESVDGRGHAVVWIQSLGAQFGLALDPVQPLSDPSRSSDLSLLQEKLLRAAANIGALSSIALDALKDKTLSAAEADAIIAQVRSGRAEYHRIERFVRSHVVKARSSD